MTEFLFIRHGKAANNVQPEIISGQSNEAALLSIGRAEAALLGTHLDSVSYKPDFVFSSPATRASETARIALNHLRHDHRIVLDDRLLEMSQGDWEGKPRATHYTPENIALYELDQPHGKAPGAESLLETQDRILSFTDEKTEAYPDSQILVITHGLVTRALAGFITGQSKQEILKAVTPNVSASSFTMSATTRTVNYVGKNVIEPYT